MQTGNYSVASHHVWSTEPETGLEAYSWLTASTLVVCTIIYIYIYIYIYIRPRKRQREEEPLLGVVVTSLVPEED